MFHGKKTYQGTSSSKTSFTMNSYRSWIRILKVSFAYLQEISYYFITWIRAIYKEEICMRYTLINKSFSIILSFIEPYHLWDVHLFKYSSIFFRSKTWPLSLFPSIYRAHKGHKFIWNYPIEVSVFNSFIEFIFFYIECSEIIPSLLDSKFETLKAMKDGTLIVAFPFWCVTERLDHVVILSELCISICCVHL